MSGGNTRRGSGIFLCRLQGCCAMSLHASVNSATPEMRFSATERVYTNQGNPELIDLLSADCRRLLDIGCGAGDNAALITRKQPECAVYGITHSAAEATLARLHMTQCWVCDIERVFPEEL